MKNIIFFEDCFDIPAIEIAVNQDELLEERIINIISKKFPCVIDGENLDAFRDDLYYLDDLNQNVIISHSFRLNIFDENIRKYIEIVYSFDDFNEKNPEVVFSVYFKFNREDWDYYMNFLFDK